MGTLGAASSGEGRNAELLPVPAGDGSSRGSFRHRTVWSDELGSALDTSRIGRTAVADYRTDFVSDDTGGRQRNAHRSRLGAFLGIGVIAVLSGLRLGGEWLDRHSGLGLGSVFNPEWTSGESACGSLVLLLGVAAFLSIEPIGGEWLLLRSLVESFHAIPVGSADCSMAPVELLSGVMQQSVVLGLRVAMPLVATMMLVDMTLAFAGRSSPHLLSSASLAMRAGVGLIVLALTMTTVPEVIATTMMSVLQCTSVGQK